jgi:hypothetical protein
MTNDLNELIVPHLKKANLSKGRDAKSQTYGNYLLRWLGYQMKNRDAAQFLIELIQGSSFTENCFGGIFL